jgi:hypothetical protein
MIEKRSILITVLGIAAGAALSFFLYHRFRITAFFLFIPFFSLGGMLFRGFGREREIEVKKEEYSMHPDDGEE